jgi:hypothetical protein
MRPSYITNEDIQRWSEKINADPLLPAEMVSNPIIMEICYAGQWLSEKLAELECPEDMIGCILYTAGQICFGRQDPWEVHQIMLEDYVSGDLEFEEDAARAD